MTTPDDRLAALFAQDLPPARDPVFSARVLEAAARRRFLRDLGAAALASLGGAALLAMLGPVLAPAARALAQGLAPAALALGAAALIVGFSTGRLRADLSLR